MPRKMLKRDWIGRYVRLYQDVVTKGGTIFAKGEVLLVTQNRGGLTLEGIRICPTCESRYRRRVVSRVSEGSVILLAPDFAPDDVTSPLLPQWVALCDDLIRYMESPDGPIEWLWHSCDIGFFEDLTWTFEETLQYLREGVEDVTGLDTDEPEAVALYRRLLALRAGIDQQQGADAPGGDGVNLRPGQKVRYLGRSGKNVSLVLLDRRSLLDDSVPYRPYTEDDRRPNQIEVDIVGMVGIFEGYQGHSVVVQVKFPFSARSIRLFGVIEDFELVS